MKNSFVLYWQNKQNHKKWQCFETEDKAIKWQKILLEQKIRSYLAKDI